MHRVSVTDLKLIIAKVNDRLERLGSVYNYKTERRNGSRFVDIYRGEICLHAIAGGSIKDCVGGLYVNAFDHLYDAATTRIQEMGAEVDVAGTYGNM